jgi:hypothetical protein
LLAVLFSCSLLAANPTLDGGFNLDLGLWGHVPANTYSAAASAGFWNSGSALLTDHDGELENLLDLAGAQAHWLNDVSITFDPQTSPVEDAPHVFSEADADLLGDFWTSKQETLEMIITGLPSETYTFYLYIVAAHSYGESTTITASSGETEASSTVTGNWHGEHRIGESYVRFVLPTDGEAPFTFSLENSDHAFINGLQVALGDASGDDAVRLAEALDAPEINFSTSQELPWTVVAAPDAVGGSAARAPSYFIEGQNDSKESSLTATISGPGRLSWQWWTDGFLGRDLEIRLDGQPFRRFEEIAEPQRASIMIGPGEHSLTWAHQAVNHPEPLPTVWLDSFIFEPGANNQAPIFDAITTNGLPLELNVMDRITKLIRASDPDGDLINFDEIKLPLGFSTYPLLGPSPEIRGLALRNQRGLHLAQFRATDGVATTTLEFDIRIMDDHPAGFVAYETQQLTEEPPVAYRWLGRSLALAEADVLYSGNQGNVGSDPPDSVVFEIRRVGNEWEIVDQIADPSGQERSGFGQTIAASESWLVVGAPYIDQHDNRNSGAVYVYKRENDGSLTLLEEITDEPLDFDLFGRSLALSGEDLLAVADQEDMPTAQNAGRLHFYRLHETEIKKVGDAQIGPTENQVFGKSLAASEKWIVAASDETVDGHPGTNTAYLYPVIRSAEGIFQGLGSPHKLTVDAPEATRSFGESFTFTEDRLFIGAPGWGVAEGDSIGRVSYYDLSSGVPEGPGFLNHPEPVAAGHFGRLLAASGGFLAVGARGDDGDLSGTFYLYRIDGDEITLSGRLSGAETLDGDQFGRDAVVLTTDRLITSSPNAVVEPDLWYSGRIHFYDLNNFSLWKAAIQDESAGEDPDDLNDNGRSDMLDFFQSASGGGNSVRPMERNGSEFIYFEMPKLPPSSGLTYEVEASYDLVDWATLQPERVQLNPHEIWSIPAQENNPHKAFFRIRLQSFDQAMLIDP